MTAPRSGDRRRATRGSAETALAEALTALRRGTGLSMDAFELRTGVSKIRMQLVEIGYVTPDPSTLEAYLRIAQPDGATRARLEDMCARAGVTRLPTALETVVSAVERDRTRRRAQLNVDTERMLIPVDDPPSDEDGARTRSDVRYSIAKPAWRRQNEASQADPGLWPDPGAVTAIAEFTAAMQTIKSSTGMSYEALAQASRRHGYPLARSTVHALCTKEKLPNAKAVGCFISICGGSAGDVHAWNAAWQRLAQTPDLPAQPPEEAPDEDEESGPAPAGVGRGLWVVIGAAWLASIVLAVVVALALAA